VGIRHQLSAISYQFPVSSAQVPVLWLLATGYWPFISQAFSSRQ
jgi:hypothetical protein